MSRPAIKVTGEEAAESAVLESARRRARIRARLPPQAGSQHVLERGRQSGSDSNDSLEKVKSWTPLGLSSTRPRPRLPWLVRCRWR